jgi:hypothetical protein
VPKSKPRCVMKKIVLFLLLMPLNALASFSFSNTYANFYSTESIGRYSDGTRVGILIYDLKKIFNDRYRATRVKTLVDCDDKETKIVDFRYYAKLEDAEDERINSESMAVRGSDWTKPEENSIMEKFVAFACSSNPIDLGSNPYSGMSDEPESLFDRWVREGKIFN